MNRYDNFYNMSKKVLKKNIHKIGKFHIYKNSSDSIIYCRPYIKHKYLIFLFILMFLLSFAFIPFFSIIFCTVYSIVIWVITASLLLEIYMIREKGFIYRVLEKDTIELFEIFSNGKVKLSRIDKKYPFTNGIIVKPSVIDNIYLGVKEICNKEIEIKRSISEYEELINNQDSLL